MTEAGPFDGLARFYAGFRPGYPAPVFDLLIAEASLTSSSRMLDLGCGPGSVAIALAGRVQSVTGVDMDEEMLAEAARLAAERGLGNLRWVLARAEEFDDEPGTYQLVVIASAFHWMDRPVVAAKAHSLLAPGGVLAVLGNPTPLHQILWRDGVGASIAAVQDRWFDLDHSPSPLLEPNVARHEEVLQASPFGSARVMHIPTRQEWDVSSLVGFLRSTSWRPDQILGDRFPEFVAELEQAIYEVEPTGQWTFESSVEVILARR